MFTWWFAQVVRLDAQSRVLYWHNKCVWDGVVYIDIVTVPELLPLAVDVRLQPAWPPTSRYFYWATGSRRGGLLEQLSW